MSDLPRRTLSRDRLFAGAVALADDEGIGALTMRTLADRVGVKPMTLYHHVANKDEVLDGMVDMVFAEIEVPGPDVEWRVAMRTRALSARAVLLGHSWAVGLMESRTAPGPATLRHHDAVLGCLRRAGCSLPMAAHAYSLLDSYTYGFVLQEVNLPFSGTDETHELAGGMLDTFPADEYPHLVELTIEHVMLPGYDYGEEFAFGLDLILDGLADRVDRVEPGEA
ncbi:MAG: TetR/AcrR family transcriptional regulator [Acidimicrobiia bacterium]|nr:TetR/AcrR family transcriptional regulator [Acidimicrobiia bacterium]